MPAIEVLRRQLDGVHELHSVVRAMKSLSAARIRQCREAVDAVTSYGRTVDLGLQAALRGRTSQDLRTESTGGESAVLIVFGSDQGLVGAFNTRIAESTVQRADALGSAWRATLVVGSRTAQLLETGGHHVHETFPAPASPDAITAAVQDIIPAVEEWRVTGGIDQFLLGFNTATAGQPLTTEWRRLFPLESERLVALANSPWPTRHLPAWRVAWPDLYARLIRESLFVRLFQALAASLAAENASRLAAMQSAETRIEERLAALDLAYRQQRQQAITEELLEVTAGFETLVEVSHTGRK